MSEELAGRPSVRAKFSVLSKTTFGKQAGATIVMQPVYSSDPESENKAFWDATPSGKIEMHIKSSAAEEFEPGVEYYIDFTRAS